MWLCDNKSTNHYFNQITKGVIPSLFENRSDNTLITLVFFLLFEQTNPQLYPLSYWIVTIAYVLTQGSQLCLHALHTPPQNTRAGFVFAFWLSNTQTRTVQQPAVVAGERPSTAVGCPSPRSGASARGLILIPSGSVGFRKMTGSREAIMTVGWGPHETVIKIKLIFNHQAKADKHRRIPTGEVISTA